MPIPKDEELPIKGRSVAYVLKRFPRLSETFILNEILALEDMGLGIRIISIHQADTRVHKHSGLVRAPVYYIPESILAELPQMLRAQGHFLGRYPGRWIRAFSIMFWRHNPRAVRHWLKAGLVARRLEGTNVGHVHAHFSTSPTTIAMITSTLLGLRYSLTCHAKDVYAEGRLHSPGFFRNLIRARFVVVVSERTKEDILKAWPTLPSHKLHVIYNGLDLRRFRFRPSEANTKLILSVGRLIEKKGFPYVVEACQLLKSWNRTFTCEIVGYGSMKPRLLELATTLQLGDTLSFTGPLTQDELMLHYQEASVFCLATMVAMNDDRDVLPNVLKEAMAVGVPVVTTSIPGMEELVEHERTGLLVPTKDSKALAVALGRLLEDQVLRRRLAIAGRRLVEERFDMAKNMSQLLALLQVCLASEGHIKAKDLEDAGRLPERLLVS